jgi:histidyl-tRNA synthetase
MNFKSIRGVRDILPGEIERIQRVEALSRSVFETFGYSEIRLPVFEVTELFGRGIGSSTDIVEKEMYTFTDRDGTSLSLRPEGTASVVRAYVQHQLNRKAPVTKLYYLGPMFRYERPQAGRYRQFYQVGIEAFGSVDPMMDIEILTILHAVSDGLGLSGTELQINSLGDPACRPAYRTALKDYLSGMSASLCDDCRRRLETNPLRILDCKQPGCREVTSKAPSSVEYLCGDCRDHFDRVRAGLSELKIPFSVNERLVRGLDYYTRTAFELTASGLGSQNAIIAGGRYDGLVEALGGPPTPGIGFAMGVERIASLIAPVQPPPPDVFFALLGEEARRRMLPVMMNLRKNGLRVETDYAGAGLKKQMGLADKLGARYTLIVGDNELTSGKAVLRNMSSKEQQEPPLETLEKTLKFLVNP